MEKTISIKNKKASFEYYLLEHFTAGMVLTGTEIKSIREGKANLTDAYCTIISNELFVKNLHIAEYSFGNQNNHEAKRDRKLLITKKELRKIISKLKDVGVTLIPVHLFINEKGLAKIEIAIAKGKKLYDKRDTLKQNDLKREIERNK